MYRKVNPLIGRESIAGFVLAGGSSSRLGHDKVLLPWNGQTLLDHAIVRLQEVCSTVRVCANREDLGRYLPSITPPIHDTIPGAGPLAGIVAALEQSKSPWNFFLAVDLPLIPVELLRALAVLGQNQDAAEESSLCILPRVDGRPQPLCALYHLSLLHGLRGALEEGKYKIMPALEDAMIKAKRCLVPSEVPEVRPRAALGMPMSWVEWFDVQSFAATTMANSVLSPSDWFLNVNTPLDWQRANELSAI